MKVIVASYDGHINSSGFKDWEEARLFVLSRIPKNSFVKIEGEIPFGHKMSFWTRLEYYESDEEGQLSLGKNHVWELNQVEVLNSRSS